MDGSSDTQFHVLLGEFFDNVPGIGQGTRQPVELGDHEGISVPDGGQRLVQAGPVPVRAGQPVVGVDPLLGHTQGVELIALGSEILLIRGDAGVADHIGAHGPHCSVWVTVTGQLCGLGIRESREFYALRKSMPFTVLRP